MTLGELYKSPPAIGYAFQYNGKDFAGIYVGEYEGYYRFITNKEVLEIEKLVPMEFFHGEIPDDFDEILKEEQPEYYEMLIPVQFSDEDILNALKLNYFYEVANDFIEEGEIAKAKKLLMAAKEVFE